MLAAAIGLWHAGCNQLSVPERDLWDGGDPPHLQADQPGVKNVAKKNKKQNTNADDPLRGGTQPTGTPPAQPDTSAGGTNALSPTGTARPTGHPAEPPTGDKASAARQDPYRAVEDGRTQPSPSVAAQRARDDADVEESTSGIDENSPRQIPENAPTADGRNGND
jgi:hypothetical protein